MASDNKKTSFESNNPYNQGGASESDAQLAARLQAEEDAELVGRVQAATEAQATLITGRVLEERRMGRILEVRRTERLKEAMAATRDNCQPGQTNLREHGAF